MTIEPTIHVLLDRAFADTAMTPDLQDLKEELRASLIARSAELESGGAEASAAAQMAFDELGDIPALIDTVVADDRGADNPASRAASTWARQRVRPDQRYILRTALLCIAGGVALVVLVLGVMRVTGTALWPMIAAAVMLGAVVAAATADALRQETTIHYPAPPDRAIAWGVASGLAAAGCALAATYAFHRDVLALAIVAGVLLIAGVAGLAWCGLTQTNRSKAWVLEASRDVAGTDRFTQDPAAAARFGIYTMTLVTVGIAAFVALSLGVGFRWSWLAIVATVATFFLLLARMNFPGGDGSSGPVP